MRPVSGRRASVHSRAVAFLLVDTPSIVRGKPRRSYLNGCWMDGEAFNAEAAAFAAAPAGAEGQWTLASVRDALGCGCAVLRTTRHRRLPTASTEHVVGADLGAPAFETTADAAVAPRSAGTGDGAAPNADVAVLEFFVLYSDAYAIPVVYFAAHALGDGRALGTDAVKALMPRVRTGDDDRDERFLLVTHSFCDVLGRALWYVHPCDTQAVLQLMSEARDAMPGPTDGRTESGKAGGGAEATRRRVRQTSVEQLLRLLGPMLGLL